jgi:demethylmenaquinone methyltransferase/2-methoxy-6-polyprenyl-1,4-benzoquinol methylase
MSLKTPFNFSSPAKPEAHYIQDMFDKLAQNYDRFTLLTGFGQAHRWRREALKPLTARSRVLDIGCGTGDLALMALKDLGPEGAVVGLDFSEQMLKVAQRRYDRLPTRPSASFRLVHQKAEDLPLDGQPFDLIVSGFVLRNLYENIVPILAGVHRSLRPGGQIRFLDLTEPRGAIRKRLFRFYMMSVVGTYGFLLFGKDYPIPYLPDSASRFLKADEFTTRLEQAGFHDVRARSFMLGTVTLYQGTK